jgi:hypothetical protein
MFDPFSSSYNSVVFHAAGNDLSRDQKRRKIHRRCDRQYFRLDPMACRSIFSSVPTARAVPIRLDLHIDISRKCTGMVLEYRSKEASEVATC